LMLKTTKEKAPIGGASKASARRCKRGPTEPTAALTPVSLQARQLFWNMRAAPAVISSRLGGPRTNTKFRRLTNQPITLSIDQAVVLRSEVDKNYFPDRRGQIGIQGRELSQ
jgi:hypothetical protein